MKGPWLGAERGYLADWVTQRWVRATGRRVRLEEAPWLGGPCGSPRGIGRGFFEDLAEREGLEVVEEPGRGLMHSFDAIGGKAFDPSAVDPAVVSFYENTSDYRLDAWSQWCGPFRPFGWLLGVIFSRRLQQLNVPLTPLETSRGLDSRVVCLVDPATGTVRHTGWVREVPALERVVYVGDYSTCTIPGARGPCVKVVFPLPNGSATVILRPEAGPDGSLLLHSSGRRFGDPGFYFVVRHREQDEGWARYLPTLRELIHVYTEDGALHTDHLFRIWGLRYLQLHYRMTPVG